jgi:hypothetical protein
MAIEGAPVVRVDFGETAGEFARKERKLQPVHRHMAAAVADSGKAIGELIQDPFNGYRYLLRGLLRKRTPSITLDQCSDLIDSYCELHRGMTGLSEAIVKALSLYLHIEMTPTDDEEEDGERPPQAGAAESAPAND